MKDAIIKWGEEKVLGGINCFVNQEGRVIILNCNRRIVKEKEFHSCIPLCDTTIESLEKYDDDLWSEFDVFTNKVITDNGEIICGGEGQMGNQGFITCTNSNNEFIWSLFFVDSNPFYKINIEGNEVHAFSSYNLVFIINLKKPWIVKIEKKMWQ